MVETKKSMQRFVEKPVKVFVWTGKNSVMLKREKGRKNGDTRRREAKEGGLLHSEVLGRDHDKQQARGAQIKI